MMAAQTMEEKMKVYHYTSPGVAKRDFTGTYFECMKWIQAQSDASRFYIK